MNQFSGNTLFSGNIYGDRKIFLVGFVFLITGLIIGLLIPFLITPRVGPYDLLTTGYISDYAPDTDDQFAEIFTYKSADGAIHYHKNFITSSSPAYKIGDQVEVYYNKNNPDNSWIKDDKNLQSMSYVLFGLGLYFGLFGLIILILKFRLNNNNQVEIIAGTIGALSYGIPAAITYPGLYFAFLNRPNFFYDESITTFPQESAIIGLVFTLTGLLTIAGVILMLRHYKKTGSNSIHINY